MLSQLLPKIALYAIILYFIIFAIRKLIPFVKKSRRKIYKAYSREMDMIRGDKS